MLESNVCGGGYLRSRGDGFEGDFRDVGERSGHKKLNWNISKVNHSSSQSTPHVYGRSRNNQRQANSVELSTEKNNITNNRARKSTTGRMAKFTN